MSGWIENTGAGESFITISVNLFYLMDRRLQKKGPQDREIKTKRL
jgi:hypothetical protein